MSKTAIVYWSGTGNTEALANKITKVQKALAKMCKFSQQENFQKIRLMNLIP